MKRLINISIQQISKPWILIGFAVASGLMLGFLINKLQLLFLFFLLGLFPLFFLIQIIYRNPFNGIKIVLVFSFLVNGLTRYLTNAPLGLGVDGLLALTLIISLFSPKIPNFSKINNFIFWITMVWLAFTVLELFNPEARSKVAWFYAVRAYSVYQIFMVLLLLFYLEKKTQVYSFVNLSIIWCVIAAIWGYKQIFIGLDSAEWAWLISGPIKTHVLFGVLRAFSFLSDSGQFGATMGYGGIVAIFLALGPFSLKKKIFFFIAGLICLYAMALSGTRGALFVPIGASLAYLVSTKNFYSMIVGSIIVGGIFFFLKFTTIANDNYQIRRMRSALDPEDASLQVRLENQKRFKQYLTARPLGGGIGTSGSWGQRFSPGTFLAETPNDSWYVKVWAETGVIGLTLHILMLLSVVLYGYYVIFNTRDPIFKQYLMAIHAGYCGIILASYGNPILGQFPLNILIYFTWVTIFIPNWENEDEKRI